MGLDTVEIVMDVEDTFDIRIDDDVAQSIETVGELYDYIVEHTATARTGKCLTAAAFYEVRAGLTSCDISDRFGPSTKLAEIFPKANRRSFWSKLSKSTDLTLPKLIRPSWVVTGNVLVTLLSSAVAAYSLMGNEYTEIMVPLIGIPCLFLFGFLTTFITVPLATNFAPTFATFRGLSEQILVINSTKMTAKHGPMGRNDIWVLLRGLIVNALGVDDNEVVRDANFVRDLGCD